MIVELLYDKDCPNVGEARANLHRALIEAGLPPSWTERELSAAPSPLRAFGSPTVVVNGRDVAGGDAGDAASCRFYEVAGGRRGAPPAELIARVLRAAQAPRRPSRAVALVVPAIGAALVPGLACPACWPAYASLLSALGLPFVPTAPWLLPFTSGLLLVALSALAYRAESVVPVAVGLAASAVILVGKFVTGSNAITWAGAALLVGASLLRRRAPAASCPACPPAATARHGSAAIPSTEGR